MSFTTSFEKFKILFLASIVPLVMNVDSSYWQSGWIRFASSPSPIPLGAPSSSAIHRQVRRSPIDFLKSCAVGMALGLTYFSACCAAIWAGHRYLHQGNNAMTVCITVVTESSCVVTMLNVMLTLSIHAFKKKRNRKPSKRPKKKPLMS